MVNKTNNKTHKEMRQFTPEITELKPNEVFVFGSNMNGNHAGGAARTAVEKFGAIMGQAEGPQGQSYAIPTLDCNMAKVTEEQLQASLEKFAKYAADNDNKKFYLTKIGCGIAGFSEEEMVTIINRIDLPSNVVIPEAFNVVHAFKAFDKEMKCRGYQYETGKEYETDKAKACLCGFHACRNPWDVLKYYPLVDENGDMSRYATVEQGGYIDRSESDKTCSTKIKIKAELGFPGFVRACVEWIKEKTAPQKVDVDVVDSGYGAQIGSSGYRAQIGSSGDDAQIGSSGYGAQIGSSGYGAQIGSSGDDAQIGSSGYRAKIGSSGYGAQIGSSGYGAQIGSSGDGAQIGSSGDDAKIGSSGYRAQIGSSGDDAKIGSSGYRAQIGSSGYRAQIGSSGDDAQIGSSGYGAQIGSSGDGAQIGSSGDGARIESTGENSVIVCAGANCQAKAQKDSWITLSEWEYDSEKQRSIPVCVKTEYVDGVTIKADTWYRLKDGKFVECDEQ